MRGLRRAALRMAAILSETCKYYFRAGQLSNKAAFNFRFTSRFTFESGPDSRAVIGFPYHSLLNTFCECQ